MKTKHILFLVPCVAMVSGCAGKRCHVLDKYHINSGSLNLSSSAFSNYNTDFDMTTLNGLYPSYISAIQSKNIEDIKKYRGEVNTEEAKLIDKYCFAEARYNANPNEETRADYDDLIEKYDAAYLKDMEVCTEANKTENEEIINLVVGPNTIIPTDPERERELNNIMMDYQERADELDSNRSTYSSNDEFIKAGISMFMEYAPYCDEYASLYGYEDYLTYSYKNLYHRAYTPSDVDELTSFIKKDLAPKYKAFDYSIYSRKDQEKIKAATSNCFALKSLNLGKQMDQYASKVGGDYLDVYKHCFTNGYFAFSNNEKSMGTAATYELNNMSNGGLLYFSKDYQNATTIIHEFGHYFSFAVYENNINKSYDLNETFSQGNEMLFASFLLDDCYANYLHGFAKKSIDSFYNMLLTISFTVNVENYLFNNYKTKTADELFEGVNSIYNEYGVDSIRKHYFVYPVIACTGYYISYATSIEQSLQIFSLAQENFQNAYSIYFNLASQKEMLGEVEAWERAGLVSPFKESTVQEIAKYYN